MAKLEDMSRQRLDFRKGPKGEEIAILTVTLGDKSVHRFEESTDDAEVDRFAKGLANAEMKRKKVAGEIAGWSEDDIAGFWSSIKKAVKSVAKVARKIATSKVFRKAAQGLMAIAPALGPFGAAAAAVGGGMMVASKLSDASIAAESGAKSISRMMSGGAGRWARRISRGNPGSIRQLMQWGNSKRKVAMARAGGRRSWGAFSRARATRPQPQQRQRRYPAPQWGSYGRQAQALRRTMGY